MMACLACAFPRFDRPGPVSIQAEAALLEPIRVDALADPPVSGQVTPALFPPPIALQRVSLRAVDADVRTLLLAIARQAGISLVVSDDVRGRVTVSLADASAIEALQAIIAEAGLSLAEPPSGALWPPVVYYQLPVNANQASAETIAARFGVSIDLAKWIVENRVDKTVRP